MGKAKRVRHIAIDKMKINNNTKMKNIRKKK